VPKPDEINIKTHNYMFIPTIMQMFRLYKPFWWPWSISHKWIFKILLSSSGCTFYVKFLISTLRLQPLNFTLNLRIKVKPKVDGVCRSKILKSCSYQITQDLWCLSWMNFWWFPAPNVRKRTFLAVLRLIS